MYLFDIFLIIISISNVYTITPIGGNLDRLRDWSHTLPYVNLIHQAHKWGSPLHPSDEKAPYDHVTGWPVSDFGAFMISSSFDLGGTYLLYAKGNADITLVDGT
jgi:hypothetical protein